MKRLLFAVSVLFALCGQASAASRFWVPLTVTGAVSGTGGLCRLTVNNTANLVAGTPVIVSGILGALACDGTTTVTTVVSSTLVEVNLAFGAAYTSGGTVAGGQWTSTGTGNWSASSGGAGGSSVPGSADTVTFDGSSGGGTVTLNFGGAITVQSITMGAFTGTWDNSVNNNNITVTNSGSAFSISGSGTRTIKLGTATYTLNSTVVETFDMTTTTGLTLTATGSTISFTGAAATKRIITSGSAFTLGTVNFSASSGAGHGGVSAAITITTLNITAPNLVQFPNNVTVTVTNPFTFTGSAGSEITLVSDSIFTQSTIAAAAGSTATWTAFRDMVFTGSPTATNSTDLLNNSGITISAPGPAGGGGCILGGWLLWRDLTPEQHDNLPAFLDQAA